MSLNPRCLHLAASRFERLSPAATALLCQPGWTHLGEPPIDWMAEIREQFRFGRWKDGCRLWLASIYRARRPRYTPEQLRAFHERCEFREFHYKAGSRLEFGDAEFDFIVSEHFFEHLWLGEALALLKECRRILKPGGVIRTSVPDADLRTYAPPEPPGYPSPKVPWDHHQKHRSRWSEPAFSEVLRQAGLYPRPVMWCDDKGVYHHQMPTPTGSPADRLLGTLDYLRRLPSLIVDGIHSHD